VGDVTELVDVKCLSCSPTKVLLHGTCVGRVMCKSKSVVSGVLAGQTCECTIGHCQYCSTDSTGESCKSCRDGFYNHEGTCLETCPDGTAPEQRTSLFGRDCLSLAPTSSPSTTPSMSPSTSSPSTTPSSPPTPSPTPLPCVDTDCEECSEQGNVCHTCKNSKFLFTGKCIDICPSDTRSMGDEELGRACEKEYTCVDGIRSDNDKTCTCSSEDSCVSCEKRRQGFDDVCLKCTDKKFIVDGACADKCKDASFPAESDASGLFCKAEEFSCIDGTIAEDGALTDERCGCPIEIGGDACPVCTINRGSATCAVCSKHKHLHEGGCVDECPIGTTAIDGNLDTGYGFRCE